VHPRPAARRQGKASPTSEPEVIVPPGGEAALRRYVAAIRDRRMGREVVLGLGPDPVDWREPASLRQQPRNVESFPEEMEPPSAASQPEDLTMSN
jgi:hypothetical protein